MAVSWLVLVQPFWLHTRECSNQRKIGHRFLEKAKDLVDSYFIQPEMPGEISPHPQIKNAKTGERISPGQPKFYSFE